MPDRIPRDDLTDLEHRLAALRPTSDRLDRDRMLFEAGRASARAEARSRAWALSAAASALVAIGLGVGLARERSRALDLERALIAAKGTSPAHTAPSPTPARAIEVAPDSYLALSHRVLAGLDEMTSVSYRRTDGPASPAPGRPLSPRGLRDL